MLSTGVPWGIFVVVSFYRKFSKNEIIAQDSVFLACFSSVRVPFTSTEITSLKHYSFKFCTA